VVGIGGLPAGGGGGGGPTVDNGGGTGGGGGGALNVVTPTESPAASHTFAATEALQGLSSRFMLMIWLGAAAADWAAGAAEVA